MAHVNDVLSDRTVHKCTRLRETKGGHYRMPILRSRLFAAGLL